MPNRSRRTRATTLLVAASLALSLTPATGPTAGAQSSDPKPSLSAYRGLGVWIDIYDAQAYDQPEATAAGIAARGVRTIYLETCNFNCSKAIHRAQAAKRLIDAAHALGMRVVAWYLPGFDNLKRDRRRSKKAIDFETDTGGKFDSFALDIEARNVTPVSKRNTRLLRLSKQIREHAGPSYPLGAIVPPYFFIWGGEFPYAGLAEHYDVFLPMNYFTGYVSTPGGARRHTIKNIRVIRKETGIPTIPIHSIAGIADKMTAKQTRAVVRAGREFGILGSSLYDYFTTGSADWNHLSRVPVNPKQNRALPVKVGKHQKALGNVPGKDQTHPKEVWFKTGPLKGSWKVTFQVWNLDQGEVKILANWKKVKTLAPSEGWSATRTVKIPAKNLKKDGTNAIGFVAKGSFPNWSEWGVRRVSIQKA